MKEYNNLYFIGAGGIGMAALERYFLNGGARVGGYDRTPTPLTDALTAEGVGITFDPAADAIPDRYRNPDDTLVVYTPAVPADMPQLRWFRDNGFEVVKRAAVLGLITRRSRSLCFAGTHGKTTTSSMAANILYPTPRGCNAFLGGILRNYGTNCLLSPTSDISVAEADEYDRSFHHLRPHVAVVTSTDPDHLDIYGDEASYLESFSHFTSLIAPGGALIMHTGLKFTPRPADGVTVYTYSADSGDFHAANIRRGDGTITFDFVTPQGTVTDISLGVPVQVNIENAIAAMAACRIGTDATDDDLRRGIATFMGAERRFQFHLKQPGRVIIDDYAHHPDELRQSILSVKALYPGRRLTVAFQPHLYSRTRDFAPAFGQALSLADRVILLDIYPARELPIPGVSSRLIYDNITIPDKVSINKNQLVETVKNSNFEILLTAGAGDINTFIPQILDNIR